MDVAVVVGVVVAVIISLYSCNVLFIWYVHRSVFCLCLTLTGPGCYLYFNWITPTANVMAYRSRSEWRHMNDRWLIEWQLDYWISLHCQSDQSTNFHAWWLKRRGLEHGCAFWGIWYCSPFWGEIPPNPNAGGASRRSQANNNNNNNNDRLTAFDPGQPG